MIEDHVPVIAGDDSDAVNKSVAVPRYATCDDGRVLAVRSWRPVVVAGQCVTATLEAVVMVEKELEAENE